MKSCFQYPTPQVREEQDEQEQEQEQDEQEEEQEQEEQEAPDPVTTDTPVSDTLAGLLLSSLLIFSSKQRTGSAPAAWLVRTGRGDGQTDTQRVSCCWPVWCRVVPCGATLPCALLC